MTASRLIPSVFGAALLVLSAAPLSLTRAAAPAFSPEPPPRPKVLLDYHHRLKPETQIGSHVLTGGYVNSIGRYRINDFSCTNNCDAFPLFH